LLGRRDRVRLATLFATIARRDVAALGGTTTNEWLDGLDLSDRLREVVATFIRLGTYAADHDALAADVAVGQLQLAVRGVRYVDGGWATLVAGLRAVAVAHGAVVEPARARSVAPSGSGVEVVTDAATLVAGAVVLAAGSPGACARLLPDAPGAWTDLGPGAYAACLDVGLDHLPPTTVLLGIDRPLYAIRHAPPAALAPPGGSVVHALRYLRADEHLDAADGRRSLEDHLRAAGTDPARAVVARYLHRMPVVSALATATRGGLAGRPAVTSSGHPAVTVAGDWVGAVGHLADASLASGALAGARAAERVAAEDRVGGRT
jgi:hypothetical protein